MSKPLPFQEALAANVLVFDGAMGTEIYRRHVFTNRCYDELCLSDAKLIRQIHREYADAGADVLTSNTFGANRASLAKYGLEDKAVEINRQGAQLASEVADAAGRTVFVAGSIGPLFEQPRRQAVAAMIHEQAVALREGGADFILFETLPTRQAMQEVRRGDAAIARGPLHPFGGDCRAGRIGLRRADRADVGAIARRLPHADRLGAELRLGAGRIAGGGGAGGEGGVAAAGGPAQRRRPQGGRVSPHRLLLARVPHFLRQAVRGAGGLGGGWMLRDDAGAHSRDRPGRQAAGPAEDARRGAGRAGGGEGAGPVCRKIAALRPAGRAGNGSPPSNSCLLAATTWRRSRPRASGLRERGIDAINIPDGPRASSRISSLIAAHRIQQEASIEAILHFCCRDRNLIGMQADLLACAACGIRNLLFVTGDPPKLGDYPHATGVFDADSIGMAAVQRRLNCGIDLGGQAIDPQTFAVIGVGLDPTALDQRRELDRFRQKVDAGAEFAITQPVFDPDVLLRVLDEVQGLRHSHPRRHLAAGQLSQRLVHAERSARRRRARRRHAADGRGRKPRGSVGRGHRDRPRVRGAHARSRRRHPGQCAAGQDRNGLGGRRGMVSWPFSSGSIL